MSLKSDSFKVVIEPAKTPRAISPRLRSLRDCPVCTNVRGGHKELIRNGFTFIAVQGATKFTIIPITARSRSLKSMIGKGSLERGRLEATELLN